MKISREYQMKNILLFLSLSLGAAGLANSTTHTVLNSGISFSPAAITINLGDTVNFVLESIHNAVEVSQDTWNANGNGSNGGFSVGLGGGIVVPQTLGIHYYVCAPHSEFGMKGTITVSQTTDAGISPSPATPRKFSLSQNYPNPFNPETEIVFDLAEPGVVSLKIFNILGAQVATLADGHFAAGRHRASWNAVKQPSGIYFYTLKSSGKTESRRMVFSK